MGRKGGCGDTPLPGRDFRPCTPIFIVDPPFQGTNKSRHDCLDLLSALDYCFDRLRQWLREGFRVDLRHSVIEGHTE